jgi:hypothetical protein
MSPLNFADFHLFVPQKINFSTDNKYLAFHNYDLNSENVI